jgi:hypothetical protein
MASILTAISSAGMRSDVWNQRRAAPKIAQAAVAETSSGSAPATGGIYDAGTQMASLIL